MRKADTSAATGCTEADWHLFTTLVRFDPVYAGHFKLNRGGSLTITTCGIAYRQPLEQFAGGTHRL